MRRRNLTNNFDYEVNHTPRTFDDEFYYINFVDAKGHYDSNHSEQLDDKRHAVNRARWLANNSWALGNVDYQVEEVVVYDSKKGFVKRFFV